MKLLCYLNKRINHDSTYYIQNLNNINQIKSMALQRLEPWQNEVILSLFGREPHDFYDVIFNPKLFCKLDFATSDIKLLPNYSHNAGLTRFQIIKS